MTHPSSSTSPSPPAHGLAVVAALSVELKPVRRMLRGAGIEPAAWLQTGPGQARAAAAVTGLLRGHPRITEVLHLGYAGALDPARLAGQTLSFGRMLDAKGGKIELAGDAEDTLLTLDQVVTRAEDKAGLFERFAAAAVDTESFAVAQVVRGAGRAYTPIRAISDESRHTLPESIDQWVSPAGRARPLKVAGHLSRHPWDLGPMIWMQRRSRLASAGLANAALAYAAARRAADGRGGSPPGRPEDSGGSGA